MLELLPPSCQPCAIAVYRLDLLSQQRGAPGAALRAGCGEVLCQTNLNVLGELEMCYDVYISRQSPFFSVTELQQSELLAALHAHSSPALRSKLLKF